MRKRNDRNSYSLPPSGNDNQVVSEILLEIYRRIIVVQNDCLYSPEVAPALNVDIETLTSNQMPPNVDASTTIPGVKTLDEIMPLPKKARPKLSEILAEEDNQITVEEAIGSVPSEAPRVSEPGNNKTDASVPAQTAEPAQAAAPGSSNTEDKQTYKDRFLSYIEQRQKDKTACREYKLYYKSLARQVANKREELEYIADFIVERYFK